MPFPKFNVHLIHLYKFFLLSGTSLDGWIFNQELVEDAYTITTRQMTNCPNEVSFGYDRNVVKDQTFTISCLGNYLTTFLVR
jgi:hypothetical protein